MTMLCCRILSALESLPFVPSQANLDSLDHFLEQVSAVLFPDIASKARLLAKLQHQVKWVQQHMKQGSDLCLRAGELVSTDWSAAIG